jgi:heme-degrading monooxygenase HmoA
MLSARTSTLTEVTKIDEGIKSFEHDLLPKLKGMSGFAGATLHVDRGAKSIVATTYWDSDAAMKASEQDANDLRRTAGVAAGTTAKPKVERYECPVVSEIRIPAHA